MLITDHIRASCAAVAAEARFVRIDESRIDAYARSLPLAELKAPSVHPERHYLGHGEDTAAFFVTLDAVNFGSGYFPHLRKRPGMSGYFTVASCLTDHFRRNGPMGANELARVAPDDCVRIFEQPEPDAAVRELMTLFARALNDLGQYLLDQFDGSFVRLIELAQRSAVQLVGLLAQMTFFNDVQRYRGKDVPFYKRAQLTAADLNLALGGEGLGRFDDLDRLTIFADNLVPHVLRIDGVLRYDADLEARIDREELVAAGSEEEVELRAGAVHAAELIVGALHRAGHTAINAMNVDYLLWHRGQNPAYKQAKPRHRTRTVFY
jgi:hypothetical protein